MIIFYFPPVAENDLNNVIHPRDTSNSSILILSSPRTNFDVTIICILCLIKGKNSRASKYEYYEKPWMRRKRIKNEVVYRANKQKVDDLTRWIIFRQQNKLPVKHRKGIDDTEGDY